jgi:hypothetical protein
MPMKYTQENASVLLRGCDEASATKRFKERDAKLSDKAIRRQRKAGRVAQKYGVYFTRGKPLSGGLCS